MKQALHLILSRWPAILRFVLTLIPVIFGLLHAGRWIPNTFLTEQDALIYDTRLRASMPQTLDPRIVIIDVDEKSLSQVGRWPWGRDQLAQLTKELTDRQQVKALAFDFVFAEPDERIRLSELEAQHNSWIAKKSSLRQNSDAKAPSWIHDARHDAQFARALSDRPVVLGYYFTSDRDAQKVGRLPPPLFEKEGSHLQIPATEWNGYGGNLDELINAAAAAGFINAVASSNGVVRSLPVMARFEGNVYESLALATWRVAFGDHSVVYVPRREVVQGTVPALEALNFRLPEGAEFQKGAAKSSWVLDNRGAVLVPYRGYGGPQGRSFEYISASDVLNGRIPAGKLAGKIALVGSTAPGLQDIRMTPVGPTFPGVEVHANLLSGIFDNRHLYQPDYAMGLDLLLIAVSGLLLASILPRLSAAAGLAFGLSMIVMAILGNVALFASFGMVLPLAALVLTMFLALAVNTSYGYFLEGYAKRSLVKIFGTYVPPELVQLMLKHPHNYSMKASNKELTVMFCDLRGFTQISEVIEPPEVQRLLNIVFDHLTAIIRAQGGTIDKYMGDCVMAFWGAPIHQPDHASKAVNAAIALCAELPAINRRLQQEKLPMVNFTIGLATGMMSVGDMGSKVRRSYTVIGDAVNLGARLQQLCERYQVSIIASARTYQCSQAIHWRYVDTVQVKGKVDPVAVYTPETK